MGKPSKEHKIVELFFNEPSRYWHFKDIVKEAKISENRANYWLKELLKEKIIIHHKENGKMPYYTANFDYANYKTKKKLYALEKFYEVGFLKHLESLDAQTIVIFGSFSRADWHSKSDIDLFIIGSDEELGKGKYERILNREIQLFTFKNQKEIRDINPNLIRNVINGYFIKGEVQHIIGETNA
ncbi:MAG: nucleotidyltransferase domain-containing protein [Candidatus Woesearchaeota archaeon]